IGHRAVTVGPSATAVPHRRKEGGSREASPFPLSTLGPSEGSQAPREELRARTRSARRDTLGPSEGSQAPREELRARTRSARRDLLWDPSGAHRPPLYFAHDEPRRPISGRPA